MVSRFLRPRPNLQLQSVMSGQVGLEMVIRDSPDLLLLDLHLPDLSGDQILRQLGAMPATADMPVAILSAEAAPAVIHDMRSRGVIAYLTKPLDLAELGRLHRLVRGRAPARDRHGFRAYSDDEPTVLYIDDSDDNIRLVQRVLKRSPDVELRTATTAGPASRRRPTIRRP